MKRLFTTACALLLVLSLLAGCGSAPQAETTEATEAKPEPVYYADYLATFSELAEQGGFTLTELPSVVLDDGRTSCPIMASMAPGDIWYHSHVYCDQAGEIQSVGITYTRGSNVDPFYAILCYYMYLSMGLPDREADEFYDTFGLLDSGEVFEYETTEGWDIYAMTTSSFWTFDIRRP